MLITRRVLSMPHRFHPQTEVGVKRVARRVSCNLSALHANQDTIQVLLDKIYLPKLYISRPLCITWSTPQDESLFRFPIQAGALLMFSFKSFTASAAAPHEPWYPAPANPYAWTTSILPAFTPST